jgi:galactose oxidase-like protein
MSAPGRFATVVLLAVAARALAEGRFRRVAPLQIARAAPLVRAGDGVLAIGGTSIEGRLSSIEEWSPRPPGPDGVWRHIGNLRVPRSDHAATVLADGSVLVTGGAGAHPRARDAELLDGHRSVFAGRMVARRAEHTATLLADGRVLVAGGRDERRYLSSAEIWDPRARTWTAIGRLRQARARHTATLLGDGRVLVVGGRAGNECLSSAELFDPTTGKWTPTAPLPKREARQAHTATALLDGRVLVTGGNGDFGLEIRDQALVFDPTAQRWDAAGRTTNRAEHTATRLRDGRVLVAGGRTETCFDKGCTFDITPTTEIWDPATGVWSQSVPMQEARALHGAALLDDGAVLLVGGVPRSRAEFTSDCELWSP